MSDPRIEPMATAICASRHRHHKSTRDYWSDAGEYARNQYRDDARAAIAALDKAVTLWTVAELDALPIRSFVQGYDGFRHEKRSGGWLMLTESSTSLHGTTSVELPARVLHRGTE